MRSRNTPMISPGTARGPDAPSAKVQRWTPVLVIAVTFAFGTANGRAQGRAWADAAEILANWSYSYGSLDWMDQIAAVVILCLGGGLIGLGGGVLTALLPVPYRGAVLVSVIAAILAGSLAGFLGLTGVGEEQGFASEHLIELGASVAFCTAFAAVLGYGMGRAGRPGRRR